MNRSGTNDSLAYNKLNDSRSGMQFQPDGTIGGYDNLDLQKAATLMSNEGSKSNDINNESL